MADKKIKTKNISQTVNIKTSPHNVFEALMDSKKHSKLTGSKAKISREVGGKIEAYDGYIGGKNLEIKADKKIVQTWHANDWPAGHWSKVTFSLAKKGKGTQLKFKHEGIPAEHFEEIKSGWELYYWKPLRLMLED